MDYNKSELRLDYNANVSNLKGLGEMLLKKGASEEAVAKYLNIKRRALGVLYKNATPADLLELIHYRNVLKYGDKLGPKFSDLTKKLKPKQIIENSSITGGENATKLFETLQKDLPLTGSDALKSMGYI